MTALLLLTFSGAVLAGLAATGGLRRWLDHHAVHDEPNARSMHAEPTLRGGGLAFAAVALLVHAVLMVADLLPAATGAWWAAAMAFALLGWWDDRHSRPVRIRLVLQLGFALACVALTRGVSAPVLAGSVLWTFAIVWSVNLYNFMDGADGLAATQAILMACAASALFLFAGAPGAALVAAALAGACTGVLRWNWPPARLFMGDAGSYFLGFEFAAFALYGAGIGLSPWLWLILGAPFVVDTAFTILARLWRGEAWWQAHRSHAYQRLLLAGYPLRRLLLALVLWHLCIAWPLTFLAVTAVLPPALAALSVYALAAIMWLRIARATQRPVHTPA